MSTDQVRVVFVLPNLDLLRPIEMEFVGILPATDKRVQAECATKPAVKRLVDGFTNQSGQKSEVSCLAVARNAPEAVSSHEALVSFRNCAALACLGPAAAYRLRSPNVLEPLFSDYFDFYPVSPTPDGKHLYSLTASRNALDYPDSFVGQVSPLLHLSFPVPGLRVQPEPGLWQDLSKAWRQRFVSGRKSWATNKLFRSLAVAYNAASVPHKNCLSFHDFGIGIALWVSAFEILFHPKSGKVYIETVVDHLNKARFSKELLNRRQRLGRKRKDTTPLEGNFAAVCYEQLYSSRNDFLHGDPVSIRKIFRKCGADKLLLNSVAPIVFGKALMIFLDQLYPKRPLPPGMPVKRLVNRIKLQGGLRLDPFEDGLSRIQSGKLTLEF